MYTITLSLMLHASMVAFATHADYDQPANPQMQNDHNLHNPGIFYPVSNFSVDTVNIESSNRYVHFRNYNRTILTGYDMAILILVSFI